MPKDPNKEIGPPRITDPNRPHVEPDKPETLKSESERTGPGSGAGRGNDLPSSSPKQRDSRSAEGTPNKADAIQSENPEA